MGSREKEGQVRNVVRSGSLAGAPGIGEQGRNCTFSTSHGTSSRNIKEDQAISICLSRLHNIHKDKLHSKLLLYPIL
jgi:hypothetical protein